MNELWDCLAKRLKQRSYRPIEIISAFVFVVFVGLITTYATTEKKNEPFNAFVGAVGAFGQVAIAFMVYRLSHRQFEYSKTLNNRQVVIDVLPLKVALIAEYHQWGEKNLAAPTSQGAYELTKLLVKADALYGSVLISESAILRSSYEAYVESYHVIQVALKAGHDQFTKYAKTNVDRASATNVAHGQYVGALYAHLRSVPDFHSDSV